MPAQAQIKLEHKFVEGTKTVTHTNMKLKQTLTIAGMNSETESDRFVIASAVVGKRDADGKLRVDHQTDKLSVTLKGAASLSFDSDDPNRKADNAALEPFLDVMRAMSKAKLTLIHDKSGKVVAVEGLDKIAADVPETLRSDFDEAKYKKNINQELDRLPADPVKPEDTWTRTTDLNLGSGQILSMTLEYKYIGATTESGKTFDKIEAKTTSTVFSIADDSKLPIKVAKSDLKPTESSSTLLFDRAAGQWYSTKGKIRIQGDLNLTINGQELPGKLDLTIESETTRQP